MRKAATAHGSNSNAPSPVPGAEPAGYPAFPTAAEAMKRTASGGGRAPSALSVRKDSPLPKNEPAIAGPPVKMTFPTRPQGSRNSSASTAVLTQNQVAAKAATRAGEPHRRRVPSLGISTTQAMPTYAREGNQAESPSPVASTSPSSSSSGSPVQSRIIRRPPRFLPAEGTGGLGDDEEAEPAFLPFKPQQESTITSSGSAQDMGATLRGDVRDFARRLPRDETVRDQTIQSQTSDSSTSSAAMVPRRPTTGDRKPPGPLSPRRTAELAGRSPRGKGKGASREGSDGTPSMGSSFSDLDGEFPSTASQDELLTCYFLQMPR